MEYYIFTDTGLTAAKAFAARAKTMYKSEFKGEEDYIHVILASSVHDKLREGRQVIVNVHCPDARKPVEYLVGKLENPLLYDAASRKVTLDTILSIAPDKP